MVDLIAHGAADRDPRPPPPVSRAPGAGRAALALTGGAYPRGPASRALPRDLDRYYEEWVIGGRGAFIVVAEDYTPQPSARKARHAPRYRPSGRRGSPRPPRAVRAEARCRVAQVGRPRVDVLVPPSTYPRDMPSPAICWHDVSMFSTFIDIWPEAEAAAAPCRDGWQRQPRGVGRPAFRRCARMASRWWLGAHGALLAPSH
jgi:hypothetical protein